MVAHRNGQPLYILVEGTIQFAGNIQNGPVLRGPESAGATPGPICYGRGGTEPTITDANLILGRLGVDRFLGGALRES